MRSNGPFVLVNCMMCGETMSVRTTIKPVALPGQEPSLQIIVPIVIHQGDGGHFCAHPAMLLEEMGTDDDAGG